MIFALDFDKTFTADPDFWREFIDNAEVSGHRVLIVTARDEHNDGIDWRTVGGHPNIPVIWCDGIPKRKVVRDRKIKVDVWIDDDPYSILHGTSLSSREKLAEWRKTDKHRNSTREPHGESRGWDHKEKTA